MQLAFFCKFICVHSFDRYTNPIWVNLEIHMYVIRWCISEITIFFKKLLLVVAIYATCDFFANKFMCTLLTDLLTRLCWKLIYIYVIPSGVVVVERLERSLQFTFSRVERRSISWFTSFLTILLISCKIGILIKLLLVI